MFNITNPPFLDNAQFRKGRTANKYLPKAEYAGSTHNADQINALAAKFGKNLYPKQPANPASISSIKLQKRVHRAIARKFSEEGRQEMAKASASA